MIVMVTRVGEKMATSVNFYSFKELEVVRVECSKGDEAVLTQVQFALAVFDPYNGMRLFIERRSTDRSTTIVWHVVKSGDAGASVARQRLIGQLTKRPVDIGEHSGPDILRNLPQAVRRMIAS